MGKAGKKEGYTQKSVYPGITPQVASAGVQEALKVLEGRWKLTILFELFKGRTLRFSELERAIRGVSQKMLIKQLRDLERDGVVAVWRGRRPSPSLCRSRAPHSLTLRERSATL
jgi:DNA-binding HxlR family transcriptional regulator